MTGKIDPNLSRLKCLGYKYGYDDVRIISKNEEGYSQIYSKIIFYKVADGKYIHPLEIEISFNLIEDYFQTGNFDTIYYYVDYNLNKLTAKNKHYV